MAAPRMPAHEQSDPRKNIQFRRWWVGRSRYFGGKTLWKNSRQRRKERRTAERATQAERIC